MEMKGTTKGNRIKLLREKTGLSQTDLAEKIRVSKQTLYKYEHDIISNIPSDKIEALASTLDVEPEYIMGWTHSYIDEDGAQITTSQRVYRRISRLLGDNNSNDTSYAVAMLHDSSPERYELLMKYESLDNVDRARVQERMDSMLESEKYRK